jgi:hypothetical protein
MTACPECHGDLWVEASDGMLPCSTCRGERRRRIVAQVKAADAAWELRQAEIRIERPAADFYQAAQRFGRVALTPEQWRRDNPEQVETLRRRFGRNPRR